MVFFTLKIIRFVLRLLGKILRLPLTLFRLVTGRSGSNDDDEFDLETDAEPATEPTQAGATGTATDTSSGDAVPAVGNAVWNLTWFRRGLYGLGALQLVVAVGGLTLATLGGGVLVGNAAVLFGGVFLVALVFAALPVAFAAALPRAPTKAWYASMAYVGLQGAAALVAGVSGIFWLAIAAVLGYLGYTGRPALTMYEHGGSTRPTTQSSEPSTDALDPAASVERADDTADTGSVDRDAPVPSSETSTPDEDPAPSPDDEPDRPEPASADSAESDDTAATDETESTTDAETADATAEPADDETRADALNEYRDALTDPDPDVRADAVRDVAAAAADGSVPDQAVVDALADRVDDDDPAVRAAACEALGDLGVPDSRPLLEDRRIDPDPDVSRAASRALRNID